MPARGERGAKLTILGSGTLRPDPHRHGAAHVVEAGPLHLLLDCGWGTLDGLARYGIAWPDLTHVAVTHYHTDHVGDLSALLMAMRHGITPRRERPLTLLGPRGFRSFVERLAAMMGSHLEDPGFPLHVVEMEPHGSFDDPMVGLRLSCHPTPHTEESVAYRVDLAGTSVGYTGDTGPTDALGAFLAGCDILVAECTQGDPPALPGHLSPATLAALAHAARPRALIVTHVSGPGTPESAAATVEGLWEGTVLAGHDGLVMHLR
jgi:ribonuclease BN (tRNA processing enzyme)